MGPGQPEHGLGLVDAAVGRRQLGVLGHSPAVEQPGRPVVAGLRVHLPADHARTTVVAGTRARREWSRRQRSGRTGTHAPGAPVASVAMATQRATSMPCTSGWSCSTAPSAPTCRTSTSSADDFGGPSLEGCNEMLCLTRPDVIAGMHAAFFDVGVDAVETASFGSFSTVLTEYDVADQAHELNVAAARIAREVADGYAADGRPRYVAGSIGPGTKLPSLGHIAFAELRDAYEEQANGLLVGGVDLFLIETCYDLLQVKAAMIGCRRAMAAAGREVPLQVQVTMETTGRMLVGSEIGAALVSIAAMRPDVLGINCATGPAEMQEHLRYLSQHSPLPISVLPNAGLPSIVDGRTHYDLTPEQLAAFHGRHVTELGVTVVGGCCGTTPEHLRQVVEAVRDLEPARRDAVVRAQRVVDLQPGADRAGPQLPDHRRAHERQRLQGVPRRDARRRLGHVHEDGQRAGPRGRPRARRVRRLRRPRRRRRHGRDRQALRHPGQRAARARLDRDAGAGGRPAAHRRPGDPQLGQPRGRRAARQPLRPGDVAGPRVRRGRDLPADRRARPGPRRRVEDGDRPPHPRDRRRALRPVGRAT